MCNPNICPSHADQKGLGAFNHYIFVYGDAVELSLKTSNPLRSQVDYQNEDR